MRLDTSLALLLSSTLHSSALASSLSSDGLPLLGDSLHDVRYAVSSLSSSSVRRGPGHNLSSLRRRQAPSSASAAPPAAPAPSPGNISQQFLDKWSVETPTACLNALRALDGRSTNPSGVALCYNIPFLDEVTGVFEAELRMFNVSAPEGDWLGVTAADIAVEVSYLGASAQFSDRLGVNPQSQQSSLDKRQAAEDPEQIKVITCVGKINDNLMNLQMDKLKLQPLLFPIVHLSARTPFGIDANTTLSSTDAFFLNGVFAQEGRLVDESAKASASAILSKALATSLPGVRLAIFPVGLIVTAAWTTIFISAIGYGTWMRRKFRNQYRRRMERSAWCAQLSSL